MVVPVRRWHCVHERSTDHTSLGSCPRCSRGNGKPTRKRCGCCGGALVVELGLWTVRVWDEARRGQGYDAMEIEREFRSETTARKYVETEWAKGRDLVLHWVRHEFEDEI